MSFLVRRNLPKAWAGFYDSFARPPESPVQRPWVHIGDGPNADINALEELHIPSNYSTVNGGGESYAYMPFTPSWGFEFEIWFPVEGAAAQAMAIFFTDSWARIAANKFEDVVGVRFLHQVAVDQIQYGEWDTAMDAIQNAAAWDSPVGRFKDQYLTLRVWIEDDRWMRIWLNGIFVGAQMITPGYRTGPGRRCMRILNSALCDCWIRYIHHYDRTPSVPSAAVAAWTSAFYDDFNRSDSTTVGNGWTKVSTKSEIRSNSWTVSGGDDGHRGLIRDTGVTTGRIRIEATVGGAVGPNTSVSSGLVLCSNSAGTQGLCANIFSNKVYISRFTASLDGDPGFVDLAALPSGVTVNSGDRVAFTVWNGVAWLEVVGQRVLYAAFVHAVVPATNSWAGLRVNRASFNDSHSWNDVRILTPA